MFVTLMPCLYVLLCGPKIRNKDSCILYLLVLFFKSRLQPPLTEGVPVDQELKRWPADLAVPGSIAVGENLFKQNGVPLHTVFHYHPTIILI